LVVGQPVSIPRFIEDSLADGQQVADVLASPMGSGASEAFFDQMLAGTFNDSAISGTDFGDSNS